MEELVIVHNRQGFQVCYCLLLVKPRNTLLCVAVQRQLNVRGFESVTAIIKLSTLLEALDQSILH